MANDIIVCGGRHYCNVILVYTALDFFTVDNKITSIIQGGCKGADTIAAEWAKKRRIACHTVKADWEKYGKSAGPRRNRQMIRQFPTAKTLIWFLGGTGTDDMIKTARKAGLDIISGQDLFDAWKKVNPHTMRDVHF